MTDPYFAAKAHYFDASALVKLVANDEDEEPGRAELRDYYDAETNHFATSYCVTEALSAFKSKFIRHRINQDEYINYVDTFIRTVIGANLKIDEVPILSVAVTDEAKRLVKAYKIDFLDAFQIVTVLNGRHRHGAGESKSILITADRSLARAARDEGARVWECTSEDAPPSRRFQ